jgi:hypothetical protein
VAKPVLGLGGYRRGLDAAFHAELGQQAMDFIAAWAKILPPRAWSAAVWS